MGGYPPGMSRRDLVRGGIIEPHAHDHEFEPVEADPIIEDGAAIFCERCIYTEGEYGETYQCEECQTWRMDEVRLVKQRDGEPNITYLASEFDRFVQIARLELAIIETERNGEVIDLDPDEDSGFVVVEHDGWRMRYEA